MESSSSSFSQVQGTRFIFHVLIVDSEIADISLLAEPVPGSTVLVRNISSMFLYLN